jgi:hypothetical protein
MKRVSLAEALTVNKLPCKIKLSIKSVYGQPYHADEPNTDDWVPLPTRRLDVQCAEIPPQVVAFLHSSAGADERLIDSPTDAY